MKAVIIAAGIGSRLWRETYNIPKTLLPFGDGTILSAIMKNFSLVGITQFAVVVGYQAGHIRSYLKRNNLGYEISLVDNFDWAKGNGISVLAAEREVSGSDFILSMSDHIVSLAALERLINHGSDKNLLLVDPRINDVLDIEDATKVTFRGNSIMAIGKGISRYNGVDCGVFRLTGRFFDAMKMSLTRNEDSISAGIRILIDNNDMEAVLLESADRWIDIDTPESYQYCLKNFDFREFVK
jgi:choline kinase